jgi:hypothetical protein
LFSRIECPVRNLRFSLKAALKKAAAQDRRSVAQFTERLLEAAMR